MIHFIFHTPEIYHARYFLFSLHTTSYIPPPFHTTLKYEYSIKHFCAAPKTHEISEFCRRLVEVFALSSYCLALDNGDEKPSRNVIDNYRHTLHNFPEK